MGWFSRRRKSEDAAEAAPANLNDPSPVSDPPPAASPALDALADVLRCFGTHAFDLPEETAGSLAETMESWARRVVLEAKGSAPLADAKLAVYRRRQAEARFVPTALSELKGALLEVLSGLRGTVVDDQQVTDELEQHLSKLSRSVESNSLEEVRAQVRNTVDLVTNELRAKRDRQDQRMSKLGAHLQALKADLVEAKRQGTLDALTGLANRAALDEALEQLVMLADMAGEDLTVVMVDIDHFKRVNDTYGHPTGDAVIRATADALVRAFPRKSDVVARYGGEEFTALLRGVSEKDGLRMTRRFLRAMRELDIEHEQHVLRVTCSGGVAALRPRETAAAVLARADRALYTSKQDGRDRVTGG